MNVPNYIKEILGRSTFNFTGGDIGYTVNIHKKTEYVQVRSLRTEAKRIVLWVNRQMPQDDPELPTAVINTLPDKTHYCDQVATVTIYDPVMMRIEKYIGCNLKR